MSDPVALTAALSGTSLIEASAGTGKTWTLSGLVLRLVVEKGVPIERVLAVTFTRAATAELRERVRARLQAMLDALGSGACDDDFCQRLLARLPDAGLAGRRVRAALAAFDDAAIYTIHGFCQRALADRAFSSAMPFATEVVADTRAWLDEVVQDFWRREIAHACAPTTAAERVIEHVLASETPQTLAAWVRDMLACETRHVDLPQSPADLDEVLAGFEQLRQRLAQQWESAHNAVVDLLLGSPHLNRNRYRPESIRRWAAELDDFFSASGSVALPECFGRFTCSALAGALKKNGVVPKHAFFDAADALPPLAEQVQQGIAAGLACLRLRLLEHCRTELPRRMRAQRLQAYDDLLRNLHDALHAPGGEGLAAALRARYPAALIDEFQDTDGLQWAIFRRIYAGQGDEALFLVGDPKQAIYSFRGADVYAYLAAAASARRYPLATNQRSVPGLVAAINALFSAAPRPFRVASIGYHAVEAADRARRALIEDGNPDAAPLRFILVPPGADKPAAKREGRQWAAQTAAAEIARLLDAARHGRLRLGEVPLAARDIAVLVDDRYQAAEVRAALAQLGLGCAEQARDSVFHGAEAEALERLLLAVAEPHRETLVRGALAGRFFGFSAARLATLDEDEAAWEAIAVQFRAYHALWRDEGFMLMLRRLVEEQDVARRWAQESGGERRLTNLFHLAELAHDASMRLHGMEALINWLASQRRDAGEVEEAQLRLESDENLVQLVTIHASKGLEYPVVFCPFLWEARNRGDAGPGHYYHDAQRDDAPVLDLGSAGAQRAQAQAREEACAERLRLAYVALTRASHRCYVLWGRLREAGASPLAWLLHGVEDDASLPASAGLQARIEALNATTQGDIALHEVPTCLPEREMAKEAAAGFAARRLNAAPPRPWRLSSYSSIVSAAGERTAERRDRDALDRGDTVGSPGGGRWVFPRGAEAGDCLHGVLEAIDFCAPSSAWSPAIDRALRRAAYPVEWGADVSGWLQEALTAALEPDGFSLGLLPRRDTLREMEFHLPLRRAELGRLDALLARAGVALPRLTTERLDGYLKGYVDLVFLRDGRYWLADYKSNWLGPRPSDYARERLAQAMAQSGYHLQYLLYTVALHRWLARRIKDYDYERHFGGVYYLFLRGLGSGEAGAGVFQARPPLELVRAIDALLDGREANR